MCRLGAKLRWNVKWNESQGYDELRCSTEMQSYNEFRKAEKLLKFG